MEGAEEVHTNSPQGSRNGTRCVRAENTGGNTGTDTA